MAPQELDLHSPALVCVHEWIVLRDENGWMKAADKDSWTIKYQCKHCGDIGKREFGSDKICPALNFQNPKL